jgi:hypothetical protein
MRPAISASTLASFALALAASACHHEAPAEGPAQKAGAKVDQAGRDTKDAVKDTKDDVKNDVSK